MPERLQFRVAGREDLPVILDLYTRGLDGEALPPAQAEAIFERYQAYPSYRIFLAESEGGVKGIFSLLLMDNLGHCGAGVGVVEDVVVDPVQQGLGIGKAMMDHARELCREAGCYKMMLSSNLERTEAHAFYEAIGFEIHGYSFKVVIDG